MRKFAVAILGSAMISSVAFAARGGGGGWMFGLSVAPTSSTLETPSATTKSTSNDLAAKLGFTMGSGLYLGAVYSTLSETSDNGTTSSSYPTASAMGLGLGYHLGGFFADLNYFATGTISLDATTEWIGGSGIGVDLGYNTMLSSNFYMGFQLGYKSMSYTKLSVSGTESDQTNKLASMAPAINLGFVF